MLWPCRLSAAKQIRDLAAGRDVEGKGITARKESSWLSINSGTAEVGITEPGA